LVSPTRQRGFEPRPSSGGSNLAASNPALRKRVAQTIAEEQARRTDLHLPFEPLPADMATTSGSGLDPDITLRNAKYQSDGVVAENVKNIIAAYEKESANQKATPEQIHAVTDELRKEIDGLLAQAASRPMFGLSGDEPLINVLQVNLALKARVDALKIK
jgi:potassium-transporting ATPase KdpC subunit